MMIILMNILMMMMLIILILVKPTTIKNNLSVNIAVTWLGLFGKYVKMFLLQTFAIILISN